MSSIVTNKPLKKLRTALAILQGSRLLSTLLHEQENTVSHDQTKRVTYLTALFTRIHREMFYDWKEQVSVDQGSGPDGQRIISILVRDEVKRAMRSGEMDNTMANNFGTARPVQRR